MTIDNPRLYVDSLPDWGYLNDCFGNTKIRVGDWDGYVNLYEGSVKQRHGYVHRNGHHLLFEVKSEGVVIQQAQIRAHRDLVQVGFQVIYLWGPANDPIRMRVWREGCELPDDAVQITKPDVHKAVCTWFDYANKKVSPLYLLKLLKTAKLDDANKLFDFLKKGGAVGFVPTDTRQNP